MGEEEEEQKKILCGGVGGPHTAPSIWDSLRNDDPLALLSLACMLREALKTNGKESYMTKKIEISDVGIPDLKNVLNSLYHLPFMGTS